MKKLNAWLGGAFFATLQFSYFLLLEWRLSSTWITYAAVTLSWMGGALLGLRLSAKNSILDRSLLIAGVAGYYALWGLLNLTPFWTSMLPAYAALILVSGAYAGRFFRTTFTSMKDPRALLLHENNGFILGMLLSFIGFFRYGDLMLRWGPLMLALPLLAISFRRE